VARGEEFRLLLVYMKRYFELLLAFDRIDRDDNRRVRLPRPYSPTRPQTV
jgi:hypothetical protein